MTRPGLQKLRSARYVGNDGGPMKTGIPPKIGKSTWYFRKVKCCSRDITDPQILDIYFKFDDGTKLIIDFNERMYWRSAGNLAGLFTLYEGTNELNNIFNVAGQDDITNVYTTRNNVTTSSAQLILTLSRVQINLSKTYTLKFVKDDNFNDYGRNTLKDFEARTAKIIATPFDIEGQSLTEFSHNIGEGQTQKAKIILYKKRNTDDIKATFTANFDMSANTTFVFSDNSDNLFFDLSGGTNLDISKVTFTGETVTFDISSSTDADAKEKYDLSYNVDNFKFQSRNYIINSFNGSDYEVANFISNCDYSSSNLNMVNLDATLTVKLDNSASNISDVKFKIGGGQDISKISIANSQNISVLTTDISISKLTNLTGKTQNKLKSGDTLSVQFTHGDNGKITSHDISHGIINNDSTPVYLLDISKSLNNPIKFRIMDVSVNVADSSSIILYFDDDVSFNGVSFNDASDNFVFDISSSSKRGPWTAKQLDISNISTAASGSTIKFQCYDLSSIQMSDDIRRIRFTTGGTWNNNIIINKNNIAKEITNNSDSYFWDISGGNPGYVWPA